MNRFRKMLNAGQVADFLNKHRELPVYAAVSLTNPDEPGKPMEFIMNEERTKVVAVEYGKDPITGKIAFFIGYIDKANQVI